MKRLFKLLLIAIMAFPFVAKADHAAPSVGKAKVVITADKVKCEGIEYKKGSIVDIYGQPNGSKMDYYIINDEGYCKISSNKYKIYEEEVQPTDKDISENDEGEMGAIVIKKGGVDLRKGPADLYGVAGHLNQGDSFTYKYVYKDGEEDVIYVYAETENLKGWVFATDYNFGPSPIKVVYKGENKVLFASDITRNGVTIPANSILDIKYKASAQTYYDNVTCEYNNVDVDLNVHDDDIFLYNEKEDNGYIIFKKDVDLYEKANNKGNKITTIKKGDNVKLLVYLYGSIYEDGPEKKLYVEYNGNIGWVVANYENFDRQTRNRDSEEKTTKTNLDSDNKEEGKKTILPVRSYVWIAIGTAVLVACGATVLLRKNNKNK